MPLSPTKEDLTLDLDLDMTEEVDLDDTSPTVGLGLSTPGSASSLMGRTSSSSSNSATASGVRARAAMWEVKPSTPPPATRPPVGRKRSGTTATRPIVSAAAGRLNGNASRTGAVSPGPRTATGSSPSSPSSLTSPPSAFKSKMSPIASIASIEETKEQTTPKSGLKTFKLGARASPATTSPASPATSALTTTLSPAAVVPDDVPSQTPPSPDRTYSRSPKIGNGGSAASTPDRKASSFQSLSPQSEYGSLRSASSPNPNGISGNGDDADLSGSPTALGLITPMDEQPFEVATRSGFASASELDTRFLSSVDLSESPIDHTVKSYSADVVVPKRSPSIEPRSLTPELNTRDLLPEVPPKPSASTDIVPEDALELRLETIDLGREPVSSFDDTTDTFPSTTALPRSFAASLDTGSTEPETIVTPASPVDPAAPLDHRSLLTGPTPTEVSLLSPAGNVADGAPGTPGFADIPLTPIPAHPPNSPVPPAGPTRMASLFTRVLDYGKQQEPKKEPSPPIEEKKLPEPPRKPSQNTASKSFFTSAASNFSFNLPSLPIRANTALQSPPHTSPPAEHQPIMKSDSPVTLAEPKPASNWRTTMTHFLSSRGSTGTTNTATSPTVPASNSSSSTNLLLHRLDDPTSVRDRRISREYGGGDRLREGFDRVRNEMEGAARDIRREIAAGEEQPDLEGVDWSFWGAVVQDYEGVAREHPKELSKAIQHGIPTVIRGPIWQLMSSSKSAELEETYKALLKLTSPHEKAIQKDISRTFPNHKFFKHTGAGQDGLFMVVKAYSLYDREVGYTQGLAFIVATLLLNMPDEEAFCVLVRLMDSYNLRSHYLADMPGLQLRLYQFDRLLEDVLPLLHNHLIRKGVKSSMYASQWFMTLFSYRFPLSLVYRVFDIVLAEGIEAIFRFAIALLKKSEDELVKLEFEQILNVLQGDLFEAYRSPESEKSDADSIRESEWLTNDFVRDAYAVHITPLMLDHYEAEWDEKCRAQTEHTRELEQLRSANRHLSSQVKNLESSLAAINQEHVELVRQLVLAKIAKEDMENDLVKYKSMCARLSQQVDEENGLGAHASSLSLASHSGSNLHAVKSNGSSHSHSDHLGARRASPAHSVRSASASPVPSRSASPRLT